MNGDEFDIEYEFAPLSPEELPPLDETAETLLDALRRAEGPLTRTKWLRAAGLKRSDWSQAFALLQFHQMVLMDDGEKEIAYLLNEEVSSKLPPKPKPKVEGGGRPKAAKKNKGQLDLF